MVYVIMNHENVTAMALRQIMNCTWTVQVPKNMSFKVITRAHCFNDYAHLAYVRFEHSVCCESLMITKKIEKVHLRVRMRILPTHQIKYLMWFEGRVYPNKLLKIYIYIYILYIYIYIYFYFCYEWLNTNIKCGFSSSSRVRIFLRIT